MKRWKFSLESVRQLKNQLAEDAAQKCARAFIQVSQARILLAATEKEINAAAVTQFAGPGKKATTHDLAQLTRYLTALEKQRLERIESLLQAERAATLARASLEKAAREREILDRLRDRQHSTHQFHVARQEQKQIDEMARQMKRGLLTAV
jgi:flagellar export protein FliJ